MLKENEYRPGAQNQWQSPGDAGDLPSRRTVTPEEIRQILADEGYSAGERQEWLKTLLTDISGEHSHVPDPEREMLLDLVKEIIDENQNGPPIADDVL